MKGLISSVKFPETDFYFEKSSADGYAFLGIARGNVGLDSLDCYKAMVDRNYSLNSEWKLNEGVTLHRHTSYVYTLWICCEFLWLLGRTEAIKFFSELVNSFGKHPNGMVQYCDDERVKVISPNVTSAAARIHYLAGRKQAAEETAQVLYDQEWTEDNFHKAMMVVQLRSIGLPVKQIQEQIEYENGSIGWGPPMIYAALESGPLKEQCKAVAIERINHGNFRTRAICAWALSL